MRNNIIYLLLILLPRFDLLQSALSQSIFLQDRLYEEHDIQFDYSVSSSA